MGKFKPYTIHHLQLSEIKNFKPLNGNHYVVIWFEKIPLGNTWLKIDTAFQQQDFFSVVHNVIYNSVAYYMQYDDCIDWKNLLAASDYSTLSSQFLKVVNVFKSTLNQNNDEKISVIICTCNRAAALEECLSSLSKTVDNNFEIIVVDNASETDETKTVAQKFPNVKYVFEERKGLDIARNTGALHASYNIIAYTDDDVIIPQDWIGNIRSCFSNPLTMAVTGIVLPYELQTFPQYIFEKDWSFNKGYVPVCFNHAYFLKHEKDGVPAWDVGAGANMAFRREVFNLVGLFDERLDVGAAGCSGDSEMWFRILAEGWNCVYFPHVYVSHQHRSVIKDLKKQLYNYMKGHTAALLIQHEKYNDEGSIKRLQKGFPAYYYHRAKKEIPQLLTGRHSTLLTEIRGYVAGKKFYKAHKQQKQPASLPVPKKLYSDVVINNQTCVSVVIPCYNQAHFLKEAIESIFSQTYKNVEVVVIDDGSADETKQVSNGFANIKYVYVERVGLSAARNIGVQFSTGDFIMFLDADDYLYPNAIELNLYFFSLYKNLAFVSGAYDKINEYGNQIHTNISTSKSANNYLSLLQGNYIAMEATVMYRRDLFFYFCFDTRLNACEDYDLNLNISRQLPVFHHEQKIAAYRMHSANMSKNITNMLEAAIKVLKRQGKFLKNNEEQCAFEQGIENWLNYYQESNTTKLPETAYCL